MPRGATRAADPDAHGTTRIGDVSELPPSTVKDSHIARPVLD
jgi:hypothetical protein